MKIIKATLTAVLALAALAWQPAALAQPKPAAAAASAPGSGGGYSAKGADTCLECHDEDSDTLTFTNARIFKTRHAHRGDPRAPFGPRGLQCEACHGPGAKHSDKKANAKATINSLKSDSFLSVRERNDACLNCHQDNVRSAWHSSAHDQGDVACTDCHRLHVERDPVMSKATQPQVCLTCHKSQRADLLKASSHPVRSGTMACSDCHNAHGSTGPSLLAKPTLNQTCFTCHADKRGPFLWEHAPVPEDCALCHTSHGSSRPALLAASPPQMCQQCHTVAGHPSVPRSGSGVAGAAGGASIFVVAGSCTNCHTQVHGSNHPAGSKLMR